MKHSCDARWAAVQLVWGAIVCAALTATCPQLVAAEADAELDVPYVVTPHVAVRQMLEAAGVQEGEVVYDLGCGDGRFVIAAARDFGARGVGVDIDAELIQESVENARQAGVSDRVRFIEADLFDVDIKEADVVTLYLFPEVNMKLRPRLLAELRPGARVVSHAFDMRDWEPNRTIPVESMYSVAYLWIVPAPVAGSWRLSLADGAEALLTLQQRYQRVEGSLEIGDRIEILEETRLSGKELEFRFGEPDNPTVVRVEFEDDRARGTFTGASAGAREWTAERVATAALSE